MWCTRWSGAGERDGELVRRDYHEPLKRFVFGGMVFEAVKHEVVGLNTAKGKDWGEWPVPDWTFRTEYKMQERK